MCCVGEEGWGGGGGCKIQIHLFYKHIYVIRYSTITKNPMRSKAVVLSSSPWYSVFGWLRNPDTLKTETSPWVQQISFQYPHHEWDQYCYVHIMEPSSHQERVIKNPTQRHPEMPLLSIRVLLQGICYRSPSFKSFLINIDSSKSLDKRKVLRNLNHSLNLSSWGSHYLGMLGLCAVHYRSENRFL